MVRFWCNLITGKLPNEKSMGNTLIVKKKCSGSNLVDGSKSLCLHGENLVYITLSSEEIHVQNIVYINVLVSVHCYEMINRHVLYSSYINILISVYCYEMINRHVLYSSCKSKTTAKFSEKSRS